MYTFFQNIAILFLILILVGGATAFSQEDERQARHDQRIFIPNEYELSRITADQRTAKTADFSDIKISETISPSTFRQTGSSIVNLGNGDFVIVWQDDRLGSYSIYGQKYNSSAIAVGVNLLLVGRDDGYDLIEPKAASNGTGGFYLAWRDVAEGKIYLADFDNQLDQLLTPFVINDVPSGNYAGPFDIDSYTDQRVAVAWEDYGSTNDISVRLYSSAGAALSGVIKINDDSQPAAHWVPSVAFDNVGGLAVVWEDYRSGNGDIYFQRINSDGSLSGSNLGIVAGLYDDSAQYLPEIAFSDRDGYAIAWLDRRETNQDIYFQRYIPASGLDGGNVLISETSYNDWNISVVVKSGGDLVMTWNEVGANDLVKLRRFTNDFAVLDTAYNVNSSVGNGCWNNSVMIGQTDNIISSWTDLRNGHTDIYFHYLNSDAVPIIADEIIVNDDTEGARSGEAAIEIFTADQAAVAFSDSRFDDGDIFVQIIDLNGTLNGPNRLINSNLAGSLQEQPDLSCSDSLIFIVWNDSRTVLGVSGQRIFGRFMLFNGTFIGEEFVLSDSTDTSIKSSPGIAMMPNGTALTAWVDFRSGSPQIYGQLTDSIGALTGAAFLISIPATDFDNGNVRTAVDKAGNLYVSWLSNDISDGWIIVTTKYNSLGVLQDRYQVASSIPGTEIRDFDFDVNAAGDMLYIWEGQNGNEFSAYFSLLSAADVLEVDGSMISAEPMTNRLSPVISVDSDSTIATGWIDNRTGKRRLFYQLFNSSLQNQGRNYISGADQYMLDPDLAILNNSAWYIWTDSRNGGLNIYGRAISFIPVDVIDENDFILPTGFTLDQNYPNPFNPMTRIGFTVPQKSHVNISIFNILGEKIAILTDEIYETGKYTIEWNIKNKNETRFPSGIYLYKMTAANYQSIRKMILLK